MKLLDKIREMFGGSAHDEQPTSEQTANREEADRAFEAMQRRR